MFEIVLADDGSVVVEGRLDAAQAVKAQTFLDQVESQCVLDLTKLEYVSSAGLGVFMGYIENIRENTGDIKMCSMSAKIFRVFDLLGFPTLYDIVDEEENAIALFYKPKQE